MNDTFARALVEEARKITASLAIIASAVPQPTATAPTLPGATEPATMKAPSVFPLSEDDQADLEEWVSHLVKKELAAQVPAAQAASAPASTSTSTTTTSESTSETTPNDKGKGK